MTEKASPGPPMVSKGKGKPHKFVKLVDKPTVSSALAARPSREPRQHVRSLYPVKRQKFKDVLRALHLRGSRKYPNPTAADLDVVAQCGMWEDRPSDLFLRIMHDIYTAVLNDPMAGLVSPPLLASEGIVPLSIISVIPDIIQHHANMIVKAEKEIVFATNFWQASKSATKIVNAFKELSRRAEGRGHKVVIKLMYDRGNLLQIIEPRQYVDPIDYTSDKIKLPHPSEIPNIDLQVINYHKLPVGTFHCKYMIVDRKVCLLGSNNVQDRVNCEMSTHLEGPIVQSFYDMALICWGREMNPPLPLIASPPERGSFEFEDATREGGGKRSMSLDVDGIKTRNLLARHLALAGGQSGGSGLFDSLDMPAKAASAPPAPLPTIVGSPTTEPTSVLASGGPDVPAVAVVDEPEAEEDSPLPAQQSSSSEPGSSRASNTGLEESQSDTLVPDESLVDKQLGAEIFYDKSHSEMQERVASRLLTVADVTRHLNTGTAIPGTAAENASLFSPIVLHKPHKPVPMAIVNRRPRGWFGHFDWETPQNIAWLGGLKYAQRKVFIQSPNFNAKHVVDAVLAAVRRGVEVTVFMDWGFNDEGELLPGQGGTNQMVATRMYEALSKQEDKDRLKLYWYTGKDQSRPLNARDKTRNCHIKVMVIDDQIGIQGNGNMDTQSWYHSSEANVMLDSATVCQEWMAALMANQNTLQYGRLDTKDGFWRDDEGNGLEGDEVPPRGLRATIAGIRGVIRRVQGEGGFTKAKVPTPERVLEANQNERV